MKNVLFICVIALLVSTLSFADGLKIVGVKDIDATRSIVRLETKHEKGIFSSSEDWKESISITDLPAKYHNYVFCKKNDIKQEGKLSLKQNFLTVNTFDYVVHLSKKWLKKAEGKVRFVLSITNDLDSVDYLYAPEFVAPYGTHQYYSSNETFMFKWEGNAPKYHITIEEYNKGTVKYIVNKEININRYALRAGSLKDSCEYIVRVRQSENGELYSHASEKYFRTYFDQEVYHKRCLHCHGTGHIQQYVPDNNGHHTNPDHGHVNDGNNGHHTNPNHGHVNDRAYHTVTCPRCHGLGYTVEYGNTDHYISFE